MAIDKDLQRRVRKIYDSFPNKDMAWPDFLKEFTDMQSPLRATLDLNAIRASIRQSKGIKLN